MSSERKLMKCSKCGCELFKVYWGIAPLHQPNTVIECSNSNCKEVKAMF